MSASRFLDHRHPLAFAHRGGTADGLENTMAAFQASIDLGFRYLETDVHVTSDGVLVAFHDEALDRVTDRVGLIREQTWAEVSKARVGGREPIPRFADILDAWPDIRLNVDPKHDSATDALASTLIEHRAVSRVLVAAFSDRRIAAVRQRCGPALATGLGPRATSRLLAASKRLGRFRTDAQAVQVPVKYSKVPVVTPRFIEAAHSSGLAVHVWTIDDPDEMTGLLDMGVDGLMTDRPEVLRDVMVSRGYWDNDDA